jgi:hypothetical protein
MKNLQPIHYISIMICIIAVFMVYDYHIVQDNIRLKKHEQCMNSHNFEYTDSNCEYCDSLIKKE